MSTRSESPRICLLEYSGKVFERFINLGDNIQTLAISRLVPHVDGHVCREALDHVETPCTVPLNGFFMNTGHWPPSSAVRPVFFSFHIAPQSQKIICSPEGIAYLKQWQPIGCRDRGTMAILVKHGVEAYYSRCVTLTFPRRSEEPLDPQAFLVGISKKARFAIPKAIRRHATIIDQAKLRLPLTSSDLKEALANELLEYYQRHAGLVITSKIHCAMPCIAMGIPVVFLYDEKRREDYRVKIIEDLIPINYIRESGPLAWLVNKVRSGKINWSPTALDIESLKNEIIARFIEAFQRVYKQ